MFLRVLPAANDEGVGNMLAFALSVLFGFVAFAAIAQILAELARTDRAVKARSAPRPGRPEWRPQLAAA